MEERQQFEEADYPIIEYSSNILFNLFYILLNTKREKHQIYSSNKNRINDIIKELNQLFNTAKKNIEKIEDKFLLEIPYNDSKKIFDIENTYFQTIKEDKQTLEKSDSQSDDPNLNKYDYYMNFSTNLNKVFVYVQALLEKYEKEKEKTHAALELEGQVSIRNNNELEDEENEFEENKEEKQDKLGTKYNPILPVNDWDAICKESYQELESNIKLREDLKNTEASLKVKVFTF